MADSSIWGKNKWLKVRNVHEVSIYCYLFGVSSTTNY